VYWIARHLHPVRPLVVMVPTVQIAASVVATAFSHADHDTLEGKLESWPDGLASVTKKSTGDNCHGVRLHVHPLSNLSREPTRSVASRYALENSIVCLDSVKGDRGKNRDPI
jgi:hypothetical protein